MGWTKQVLKRGKGYKVTCYASEMPQDRCVITFGDIDSNMEDKGFAYDLLESAGVDHIYVSQLKRTQYQLLSAEAFSDIVSEFIDGKKVYAYGSSLGGYAALYYGGAVNARVLAMSPRIPAHPVIDQLMCRRFQNKGFKHNEIYDSPKTTQRVALFYDPLNRIDGHYVNFYINFAYPEAQHYHVKSGGHYSATALQLSEALKRVVIDFIGDRKLTYVLDEQKILAWHINNVKERLEGRRFYHALEGLEVLLQSNLAMDKTVKDMVVQCNAALNPFTERSLQSCLLSLQ